MAAAARLRSCLPAAAAAAAATQAPTRPQKHARTEGSALLQWRSSRVAPQSVDGRPVAPFNASLYDGDKVFLHDRTHRHTETFRFPGIDQYRLQVESFADAIAGKGAELFSLESSRRNQAAIDALFEAGRTGDWVEVSG